MLSWTLHCAYSLTINYTASGMSELPTDAARVASLLAIKRFLIAVAC